MMKQEQAWFMSYQTPNSFKISGQHILQSACYAVILLARFIWRAALTTFPLVMMPTFKVENGSEETMDENKNTWQENRKAGKLLPAFPYHLQLGVGDILFRVTIWN